MYEIIILYKNFINFLLSYFYLFMYIELKKKTFYKNIYIASISYIFVMFLQIFPTFNFIIKNFIQNMINFLKFI